MMLFAPVDIPPMAEGHAADARLRLDGVRAGRLRQPIEERLPDLLRLLGVESDMNHADFEFVVGREVRLLAPMIVEESIAVETDEVTDQAAVGVVGRRFDGEVGAAGKFGEITHAES